MENIIGIQGLAGSYTEQATLKLHKSSKIKYYQTFNDTFKALTDKKVDSIVVAFANNRIQFIPDTLKELTERHSNLQIIAETYLKINHALIGMSGAKVSDIKEIHSQAPAIAQCTDFLESRIPDAEIIESHDTALSVKYVAQHKDPSVAAIASENSARLYKLSILKKSIQDDSDNITRFVEINLKNNCQQSYAGDKVSLILTTPQKVGSLARVLNILVKHNINISFIQSRIIPNSKFHINFFIELNNVNNHSDINQALAEIDSQGNKTSTIGVYKSAKLPTTN